MTADTPTPAVDGLVAKLIELAAHGAADKPIGSDEWSVAVMLLAEKAERKAAQALTPPVAAPAGGVVEAAESLFAAYRAKYMTAKGIRSNAPLRREMGELKIAINAALTPTVAAPMTALEGQPDVVEAKFLRRLSDEIWSMACRTDLTRRHFRDACSDWRKEITAALAAADARAAQGEESERVLALLADPPPEVWAACGDAVVALQARGIGHHDKIVEAVLEVALSAARKASSTESEQITGPAHREACAGAVSLPEGWVAVPLEPTDAMKWAGAADETPRVATNSLDRMTESVGHIYRAMIAAAPAPAQSDGERPDNQAADAQGEA